MKLDDFTLHIRKSKSLQTINSRDIPSIGILGSNWLGKLIGETTPKTKI